MLSRNCRPMSRADSRLRRRRIVEHRPWWPWSNLLHLSSALARWVGLPHGPNWAMTCPRSASLAACRGGYYTSECNNVLRRYNPCYGTGAERFQVRAPAAFTTSAEQEHGEKHDEPDGIEEMP